MVAGSGAEAGRQNWPPSIASTIPGAGEVCISSCNPACESPMMPLLAPSELGAPATPNKSTYSSAQPGDAVFHLAESHCPQETMRARH